MNKTINFLVFITIAVFIISCSSSKKINPKPVKGLILKIQQSNGTNGSAVTYNKSAKLYFTVIAGNAEYPLESFNLNGDAVYQTKTGVDVRGLWYNKSKGQLEGNGYNETGVFSIKLSDNKPENEANILFEGMNQPNSQSCGIFNSKNNEIIYYSSGEISKYSRKSGEFIEKIDLKDVPVSLSSINSNSVIYTGVSNSEIGILNYSNKEVYLFNIKDGSFTTTVSLPKDAVTHESFRFSYANGYIFLYDVSSRSWTGYK